MSPPHSNCRKQCRNWGENAVLARAGNTQTAENARARFCAEHLFRPHLGSVSTIWVTTAPGKQNNVNRQISIP